MIPARAGSKSVLNKNIAPVAGHPLIHYTIETALNCPAVTRVIVSTDSEEIAAVAGQSGADVPFMRPEELARDDTPGADAIVHALEWLLQNEDFTCDAVMTLQPTSPLREVEDLERAILLLAEKRADTVVSVTPARHHPYWMKTVAPDGRLSEFLPTDLLPGGKAVRRQDLPDVYALNGSIYVTRSETLLQKRSLYGDDVYAYVMLPERSIDIDTPFDLHLAKLLLMDKRANGDKKVEVIR